jgi:hypothetical protein
MENQCTATAKSTGERCQRPAVKGANVCYQHGGAAEQVQKKAQERLDEMADSVTADLQSRLDDVFARLDDAEDTDEYVKLLRETRQLTTAILDRTEDVQDTDEVTVDLDLSLSSDEKAGLADTFDTDPET